MAMVGGIACNSYLQNSTNQFLSFEFVKEAICKAINKKRQVFSETNLVSIADLGCSSGTNSICQVDFVVQEILKVSSATIQVFFSDLSENDFNTFFTFLGHQGQPYFYSAVPGSFYNRLFPKSSVHFAMSNLSLQWLSKVPDCVQDKQSPAWNPNRITADEFSPPDTVKAFSRLASEDFLSFLRQRAEELVTGGILSLTIIGRPSEKQLIPFDANLQAAWDDLIDQGVLTQESLESYNMSAFYRSMAEVEKTLELCGSYCILYKRQAAYPKFDPEASDYPEKQTLFCKALTRNSVQKHLGDEKVVELLYERMESIVRTRVYPATNFAVLVFVLERV